MKRCPECRRDYYDDTLFYCLDDGNALLEGPVTADEARTISMAAEGPPGEQKTKKLIEKESDPSDLQTDGGKRNKKTLDSKLKTGVIIAGLVGVISLGGYFAFLYWPQTAKPYEAKPYESVAILPFANESGDANFDYLSDGLSESLIDRLAQLPEIKVIARNSSFKYRGRDLDLKEVATALGVNTIVTGRVDQRGDNLSVRVEMTDVRDNRQLWGDSYSRKASDLQAVQGEIAQTVSEKLRLRLTGAQEQNLVKTATTNSEAYQVYLNGLFVSRTNLKNSLDYFIRATKLDSKFALAFYRVGWCYFYLGYNSEMDPKETNPLALAAAKRALELDDALAEAHSLMSSIKRSEWDWAGAEAESQRATDLAPNTALTHGIKANQLSELGRFEEALVESRRAQELDPLAIPNKIQEAGIFSKAGRFDEGIAKLQQIIKLDPNHSGAYIWLGYVYDAKGAYPEAVTAYQKGLEIYADNTGDKCYLGYALAKSGRRSEALAILNDLKNVTGYVSPTELAVLYVGLGDKDGAFNSLENALAKRDLQLQNLKTESHFNELRDDLRFKDLIRRVGLPE